GRAFDGDQVRELLALQVELGTDTGDADGAAWWDERLQLGKASVAHTAIPKGRDLPEVAPFLTRRAERYARQTEGGFGFDPVLHGMHSFERNREGDRWIGAEAG